MAAVDLRVRHRLDYAGGLLLGAKREVGVHANEHYVELLEPLVRQVEGAVLEDVDLESAQERYVLVRRRDSVEFFPLARELLLVEPAGHGQRLGVIGEGHVLVAALLAGQQHLFHRGSPSDQVLHMEVAADIGLLH